MCRYRPPRRRSRWTGWLAAALAGLSVGGCAPTAADVPGLKAEAREQSLAGRQIAALRTLRRARELAPEDPEIHFLLGAVALRADRFGEAEAALARAVELAPRDPRPLAAHGLALRGLRRYEEAEGALLRSLLLRPADPATLAALGETYRLWGKPEKCIARYEQYLRTIEREPTAISDDATRERALATARARMADCESDLTSLGALAPSPRAERDPHPSQATDPGSGTPRDPVQAPRAERDPPSEPSD